MVNTKQSKLSGNHINRKRSKAFFILRELEGDASGKSFAALLREKHPDDWVRIGLRSEEGSVDSY